MMIQQRTKPVPIARGTTIATATPSTTRRMNNHHHMSQKRSDSDNDGLMSQSLGAYNGGRQPVLQRRVSDNVSKISHAGYLLQRSNSNVTTTSENTACAINNSSEDNDECEFDQDYSNNNSNRRRNNHNTSSVGSSPITNSPIQNKKSSNHNNQQQQQQQQQAGNNSHHTLDTLASSSSSCLPESESSPHLPQHCFAQQQDEEIILIPKSSLTTRQSFMEEQNDEQQQLLLTLSSRSNSCVSTPTRQEQQQQTQQQQPQAGEQQQQQTQEDQQTEAALQFLSSFFGISFPPVLPIPPPSPPVAGAPQINNHNTDTTTTTTTPVEQSTLSPTITTTPPTSAAAATPHRTSSSPIKMQKSLSASFRGVMADDDGEEEEEEEHQHHGMAFDDDEDDDDILASLRFNSTSNGQDNINNNLLLNGDECSNNNNTSLHRAQSDRPCSSSSSNNSIVDIVDTITGRTTWRSKYCVLEDGILYFYRHESDADAPQAIQERQVDLLEQQQSYGSGFQQQQQDGCGHVVVTNTSGGGSASPLWEKRLAIDCVAAVRSAEVEYGKHSFELLPVGANNKEDKLVLQARNAEEMSEWLFQFHRSIAMYVRNMVSMLDSWQLNNNDNNNAGPRTMIQTPPFPGHKNSSNNHNNVAATATTMITPAGTYFHPGDIHHPSFPQTRVSHVARVPPSTMSSSYVDYSPMRRAAVVNSSNIMNNLAYSPRFGQRPICSAATPSLSHGHGRNSKHRRRLDGKKGHDSSDDDDVGGGAGADDEATFDYMGLETTGAPFMPTATNAISPEPPMLPFPVSQEANNNQQFILHPSPANRTPFLSRMQQQQEQHPSQPQSFDMDDDVTSPELSAPPSADPETERPIPVNKGKYVPPHLRKQQAAAAAAASSAAAPPPAPCRYVPPHLRGRTQQTKNAPQPPPQQQQQQQQPSLSLAERAEIAPPPPGNAFNNNTMTGGLAFTFEQESPALAAPMSPSVNPAVVKLGGCADPTVVNGSIMDAEFIPRKASKLGKVHTAPYGCNNESIHSGNSQLRWEIGAVSECGVRNSNEDAYLIAGDLLEAFASNNDTARTHFHQSEDGHLPGLFCVFDGHCGDHAARFAAEKLTSFLHKESVLGGDHCTDNKIGTVERILLGALKKLDQEFCEFSGKEDRDWESGATALVVLFVNGKLVIANLGDARGVVCRSVDEENDVSKLEQDGWTELPVDDYNGPRRCLWKEVTDAHSPAREDERIRIEEAGGWITTEKEIPIGQVHRMVLEDQDVVDILHRCFADRYQPSSKAAAPQRILHISRVCGELAVSRALGDKDFKAAFNPESQGTTEAEWDCPLLLPYPDDHNRRFRGDLVSSTPDVQAVRVGEPGVFDEYLLLACDGLWDVMDTDDAVRVTRDLLFEKNWPAKKAAARLAELAIHLGSSDNITVIVLRFYRPQQHVHDGIVSRNNNYR